MSSFELTEAATWAGRPVARQVTDARSRTRVVVTGTIRAAQAVTRGTSPAYCCTLDDGTGQLDLLFLGRTAIPGLTVGTRCSVEGTARTEGNRMVVWNPLYRLEVLASITEDSPAARATAVPATVSVAESRGVVSDGAGSAAGTGSAATVARAAGLSSVMLASTSSR